MSEHKYFSYSDEFGFETHETEKQAKSYADESLDDLRNDAGEGWDDGVESLCWGEINQAAVMCDEMTKNEALKKGIHFDAGCDYCCDYKLEKV